MAEATTLNRISSIFLELAARLSRWGKPAWRILTFSPSDDMILPGSNVCASIREGYLSAAYGSRLLSRVRPKGFKKLQSQESYARPDELASFLALAASDFNSRGTEITLSIPKSWTIVRTIELPASVKENLSDVITYELDRFTPLSPESAFYDFRIISEDAAKITVMLAAARADVVNPYLAALSEKGFNVNRLTSEVFTASAMQNLSGRGLDSLIRELEGLSAGPHSPVSQENVSYNAYGGVIESLKPGAGGLNLLSKGRHPVSKTPMFLTTVLLFAAAALTVYYMISPVQIEKNRLESIELQLASLKDDVRKAETIKKEIEDIEAEIAAVRDFKGGRTAAIELAREITALLPKTAWLTRLRITSKNIEIEGYAASPTELLPKLEASKRFSKVEFSSPSFFDARLNASKFMIRMEREDAIKTEGAKEQSGKK